MKDNDTNKLEELYEAPISSHLHKKPFQLAVTNDPTLPIRKWDHLGTIYAVSAISAIHSIGKTISKEENGIYFCSDGSFVRVS